MSTKTVRTKDELKAAQEAKVDEIVIQGELATKIKKAKKITKIGAAGLVVLTTILGAATVTAPVTGGLSYFVAAPAVAPAAALTGTEIAVIIVAASVGIALIFAIFKEYEEIEFNPGPPPSLKLKRKSS